MGQWKYGKYKFYGTRFLESVVACFSTRLLLLALLKIRFGFHKSLVSKHNEGLSPGLLAHYVFEQHFVKSI